MCPNANKPSNSGQYHSGIVDLGILIYVMHVYLHMCIVYIIPNVCCWVCTIVYNINRLNRCFSILAYFNEVTLPCPFLLCQGLDEFFLNLAEIQYDGFANERRCMEVLYVHRLRFSRAIATPAIIGPGAEIEMYSPIRHHGAMGPTLPVPAAFSFSKSPLTSCLGFSMTSVACTAPTRELPMKKTLQDSASMEWCPVNPLNLKEPFQLFPNCPTKLQSWSRLWAPRCPQHPAGLQGNQRPARTTIATSAFRRRGNGRQAHGADAKGSALLNWGSFVKAVKGHMKSYESRHNGNKPQDIS